MNTLAPMPAKLDLPRFVEAMSKSRRTGKLPATTVWRYQNGIFPDAVYWMMLDPKLLAALKAEAEALSPETVEELERIVYRDKRRAARKAKK